MNEDELSHITIGCAIEVHKALGPGLLESAYVNCLAHELSQRGLLVEREIPIPVVYKTLKLDHGYRLDILLNRKLVIEVKSVEGLNDLHFAQLLTYLRFGHFKLGLLLNFNVTSLKQGIKRIIHTPAAIYPQGGEKDI